MSCRIVRFIPRALVDETERAVCVDEFLDREGAGGWGGGGVEAGGRGQGGCNGEGEGGLRIPSRSRLKAFRFSHTQIVNRLSSVSLFP